MTVRNDLAGVLKVIGGKIHIRKMLEYPLAMNRLKDCVFFFKFAHHVVFYLCVVLNFDFFSGCHFAFAGF